MSDEPWECSPVIEEQREVENCVEIWKPKPPLESRADSAWNTTTEFFFAKVQLSDDSVRRSAVLNTLDAKLAFKMAESWRSLRHGITEIFTNSREKLSDSYHIC